MQSLRTKIHGAKVSADREYGLSLCRGLVEQVAIITRENGKEIRGRTEFQFHVARKWRLDVAFPTHCVALELNGWKSHHRRGRMEEDNVKLAAAVMMGWRVFYATADQVKRNAALWIVEALKT
jgi:very-short-patch-repair endonuclease